MSGIAELLSCSTALNAEAAKSQRTLAAICSPGLKMRRQRRKDGARAENRREDDEGRRVPAGMDECLARQSSIQQPFRRSLPTSASLPVSALPGIQAAEALISFSLALPAQVVVSSSLGATMDSSSWAGRQGHSRASGPTGHARVGVTG